MAPRVAGKLLVSQVMGDAGALHRDVNRGALFQVASQFNLLEMTGPDVTPEDGVTVCVGSHAGAGVCDGGGGGDDLSQLLRAG